MSSPIPRFTRLSDSISFFRPEDTENIKGHPSLIVLCTWMAAAPKHIAKYTAQYQHLFPNTSIILCQCSLPAIFYSAKKQLRLLAPAQDVIQNTKGRIILHAFSNGGGTIACHLSTQLKATRDWNGFERVILDCTPSIPTVSGAVDAISFSLPRNPILRALGRWLLRTIIFTYLLLFVKLARKEDGVHWIRRTLNDTSVFGKEAERLYVYSAQDALVQDWAVAAHAKDARGKGFLVREDRFEVGVHCALGVGEGAKRYWRTVGEFLEKE